MTHVATDDSTDPSSSGARNRLRWLLWPTAVVVAGLLVYLVLMTFSGTSLIPGTTTGDEREANLRALRTAASTELAAFINQDYRTARTSMNTLISGATGKFEQDLNARLVTDVTAAAQYKTKAVGVLKKLSVSALGSSTATLLAVVTQTVTNAQTAALKKTATCAAGSFCPRYYLVLSYQLVDHHWKMSDLRFLPL